MIRFISLLVSIPLIILIAAFSYKNAQFVSIDLFLYQINIPLAVVLLITLLLGFVIGYAFNLLSLLNQKQKYFRLKNKKETLQGLSGVLSSEQNKPDV